MIDQTNSRIGQATVELLKRRAQQQAFDRVLVATDMILWELEEMNRDGRPTVPDRKRSEYVKRLAVVPPRVRSLFNSGGTTQAALDSLFEIQAALFRMRNPDWDYGDAEDLEQD